MGNYRKNNRRRVWHWKLWRVLNDTICVLFDKIVAYFLTIEMGFNENMNWILVILLDLKKKMKNWLVHFQEMFLEYERTVSLYEYVDIFETFRYV